MYVNMHTYMGIMTISVDNKTEQEFRRKATALYGDRKGALGKAVAEAMQNWARSKPEVETCLNLLEKGVDMGGVTYNKREELYDRS